VVQQLAPVPTFEPAGVGFGQGQTNPFSGAINGDPEGAPPSPQGWFSGVPPQSARPRSRTSTREPRPVPTFESAGVGFGQGQTNPFSGAINGDPQNAAPPPPEGWSRGVPSPTATTSWETIENGLLPWPTRMPRKTAKPMSG